MHIERVPNKNSHPTILLGEYYSEGRKVRKRNLLKIMMAIASSDHLKSRFLGVIPFPFGWATHTLFLIAPSPHLP